MCKGIQESKVSVVYLDMYRSQQDPEIRLDAFRGYLFWAKTLQGERKLQMLIAARKAYEFYVELKSSQEEDTKIFKLGDVA